MVDVKTMIRAALGCGDWVVVVIASGQVLPGGPPQDSFARCRCRNQRHP